MGIHPSKGSTFRRILGNYGESHEESCRKPNKWPGRKRRSISNCYLKSRSTAYFKTFEQKNAKREGGHYHSELLPNWKLLTDLVTPNQETRYTKLGAKFQEVLRLEREIWKRFIQEILPEIAPRTKWYKKFPELRVGDIVLAIEDGTPRGQWKLAVVEEVKRSED